MSNLYISKKMATRIALIFFLILSIMVLPFFIKLKNGSLYLDVGEKVNEWWEGNNVVFDHGDKLFIVYNGKLYLRVQNDDSTHFFVVKKEEDWSVDRLRALYVGHPELRRYWPDVQADDLGVQWIKKSRSQTP